MIYTIVCGAMLPLVALWIGKVEAALYLNKSDTVAAMVAGSLGVVGVLNVADNLVLSTFYLDMDERWL